MQHQESARIMFVELDEGLLWQLTRSLASCEDHLEYYCAATVAEAVALLHDRPFQLLVVDSAEKGLKVLEAIKSGRAGEALPSCPRLLVLTEGSFKHLPQELLLPDNTLFLEKPFDPREFPLCVSKALEGTCMAPSQPLVEPEAIGPQGPEGPTPADRNAEFYRYVDEGFSCLSRRDLTGAMENWLHALSIKPESKMVRANLNRLEKMMGRPKA